MGSGIRPSQRPMAWSRRFRGFIERRRRLVDVHPVRRARTLSTGKIPFLFALLELELSQCLGGALPLLAIRSLHLLTSITDLRRLGPALRLREPSQLARRDSPYPSIGRTPERTAVDRRLTWARIAVGYTFGKRANLWRTNQFACQLQAGNAPVAASYMTSILLTNLYT